MAEKPGRNDPCSCGSGKKFKKCCGKQKKMSTRETTVLSSSSAGSLLDRISGGSVGTSEKTSSLRDRISKVSSQDLNKKKK